MAEVLLTQAINEAEQAIESGNYGGAIEACQRILGQFPEFASAHRVMAEAYAEKGELDAAREAYQRTLERDPQSIPAHMGLGMLAEDAGDMESALAYVQVAWEIDPRRRDLREQVSRVSQHLYGADGRLYLTRAALASLHFHAGRWDRAVSEAAQVLKEFSSRIDVQVRLAESLWRRGDDAQAKQVCSTILRSLPSSVVPLLILADVHRREGDRAGADDYLKQARDIDPDGVRASDLIMVGFDEQAEFLSVDSVPTIDDQIVLEEPARYAPAPDFTASDADDVPPVREVPPQEDVVVPEPPEARPEATVEPAGVQPFRWEDIGDEDLEASDLDIPADDLAAEGAGEHSASEFSLPSDEEINQARPTDQRAEGFTGMLSSLDAEGMQPFDPGGGSESPSTSDEEQAADVWDDLTLPTDEELEQSRPSDSRPAGFTGQLSELEAEGMEPFDPFDGGSDDVTPDAGTDDLMGEFSLPSEQELEAARPEDERPPGFTGMLSSLDAEGMQPFDPSGEYAPDESIDDVPEPAQDAEPAEQDATMELDDLGQESPFELDWTEIDTEIEDAIPGEMPRGYTEELRSLDDHGLEPFAFAEPGDAELEADAGSVAEPEPDDRPESDELDFDHLTAGWEEESRSAPGDDRVDDLADIDSIGVMFGEEEETRYAETEPLKPEQLFDDAADDADLTPVAEQPSDEVQEADDDLDDLLSHGGPPEAEWSSIVDEPADSGLFEGTEVPLTEAAGDVPRETSASSGPVWMNVSADRLGLDEALIERAREAKQALVESGRISGSKRLPGAEVSVDAMRDAVDRDPTNINQRISLAHAMLEDDPDEALEQYRWVYRHAPERGAEIVRDLGRLIDVMREREVGVHRLLGAVYRRHGDWGMAASHYEESLSGKRRGPSK